MRERVKKNEPKKGEHNGMRAMTKNEEKKRPRCRIVLAFFPRILSLVRTSVI